MPNDRSVRLDPAAPRRRLPIVVAMVAVVGLGLVSRRAGNPLLAVFGQYPGDALWASLVTLGLAFLFPRWKAATLAVTAMVIAFAVEFSQLARFPVLVSLRGHPLGHLVLGSTFNPPDLLAYLVGILVTAMLLHRAGGRRVDRMKDGAGQA